MIAAAGETFAPRTPAWMDLPWDALVVRFSEIALKGGNRRHFSEILQCNLRTVLAGQSGKISLYHDRLLVRGPFSCLAESCRAISRVAGVAHVAPIRILPGDVAALCEAALETYRHLAPPGATFGVAVRRANKRFPLSSCELARQIGAHVQEHTHAPVHLDNPDIPLIFRVNEENIYQQGPALPGPEGLPAGASGNVMTLFSGGIDSPVATWMSMIRGCRPHFIHFHTYPDPRKAVDGKIGELIRTLLKAQGQQAKLFLIPYTAFEMGLLSAPVPAGYELILFRRFMARTACEVARRARCRALVTGDNLGQVASQTLANLAAFDDAANLPVFRPLVMANKDDIIQTARRIGTFDASVEHYKDCCSLVSRGPQTNPRLSTVQRIEAALPVADMQEAALAQMTTCTLPGQTGIST